MIDAYIRILADKITAVESSVATLDAQVQANTAQIQTECGARVAADEVMAKRIGSIEKALVGDVQSANYVPGVSGWKLNSLTGDFEINSYTLGSAAQAPERQMVSVEFASWSMYDLPKNAVNLLQFMQAELQKVPEEYRHAAEFEEFDASYGDESFNARLFLSYSRLETEEELADRLEKAKAVGTHVSIKNGEMTVTHDGVVRIKLGKLDQSKPKQPEPFKVIDSKIYISEALVQGGMIVDPERFGVTKDGQTDLERAVASGDVSKILKLLAGKIFETKLVQELEEQIEQSTLTQADQVREVIRAELRQGGLLHRSS